MRECSTFSVWNRHSLIIANSNYPIIRVAKLVRASLQHVQPTTSVPVVAVLASRDTM